MLGVWVEFGGGGCGFLGVEVRGGEKGVGIKNRERERERSCEKLQKMKIVLVFSSSHIFRKSIHPSHKWNNVFF